MKRYLLPLLPLLLAGCASTEKPPAPDSWSPPPLAEPEPQQIRDGSLFSVGYSNSLFEDMMAFRVGDILTVQLDEETRSSKSSETSLDRESGFDMPIPLIWGRSGEATDVELNREFSGDGSSSQENMLDGSITVTVDRVLPNGALSIRGEKWITLNQGDEFIRISGLIRPEDIAPDNTISSQRLANARIIYSGEGALDDVNSAGWFMRFINGPVAPM